MNLLDRRKAIIAQRDPNLIYKRRNLVCDGTNYYDTGFAPFYGENLNKDFKITMKITSIDRNNINQSVILGCKYEGTLNGVQWPGLYIRLNTWSGATPETTGKLDIGGTNYYQPVASTLYGKEFTITRKSGNWYFQLEDQEPVKLTVRTTAFNQNILIGCGEQPSGSKFRHSICEIAYFKIEYN